MNKFSVVFLLIVLYSCDGHSVSNRRMDRENKSSSEILEKNHQIKFAHQFCDERVLITVKDSIVMDKVVTSTYCEGNPKVKNTSFNLIKGWSEFILELPNRNYKQYIKIPRSKNISLYFHSDLSRNGDTILVTYWDENDPPFEE